MKKIHPLLLCLASVVLLSLPFFNGNLWLLSWIGFLPLFYLLEDKNPAKAFSWFYLFGLLFFVTVLYWLIHVTMLGWIALSAVLALYFGLFGLIISPIYNIKKTFPVLIVPCVWICLEFLRGSLFTGFPWVLMGYSQYKNLPIIQLADITGAYGVSFLIVLTNVIIYKLLKEKKIVIRYVISLLVIIALVLGYGYLKLNKEIAGEKLRVCVVQGNIPQEKKWQYDLQPYILGKYLALTRQAAKDSPDIIIWPETSVPGDLEEEPLLFNNVFYLAKEINTDLLVGTIASDEGDFYNSASLISKKGFVEKRYDKLHLVPFGEYIPWKTIFGFIYDIAPVPIGDFGFGKEYTVFELDEKPGKTFSVLICFEDVFSYLSRDFVKRGAKFLVNITNDAWFKQTAEPYQHLQSSVFRAVENRVWVVRAANTGVSCFVSPKGEVISSVKDKDSGKEIFIPGYKTQDIYLADNKSFYLRFGDIFVLCCFILCLIILFFLKRK